MRDRHEAQWRSQGISIGVARMGPVIIFGWQACVSPGDAELFKTHIGNISTLFGIQVKKKNTLILYSYLVLNCVDLPIAICVFFCIVRLSRTMVVEICNDSKVLYFIVEMSSVYGDKPSQFSQCIIRNTKQGCKIRSAMFF